MRISSSEQVIYTVTLTADEYLVVLRGLEDREGEDAQELFEALDAAYVGGAEQ